MLFGWALFGALIGIAAAQRKGFHIAIGIIGGLMLGPLAFLMFLTSGVVGGDTTRKCPHCAEFVKADAKVCKHCHRDLPPNSPMARVGGPHPPIVRPTGPRPPSAVRKTPPPQ